MIDFLNNNYDWICILILLGLNIIQGMRIDKLKRDNGLK